jgi:hypothetical protein
MSAFGTKTDIVVALNDVVSRGKADIRIGFWLSKKYPLPDFNKRD